MSKEQSNGNDERSSKLGLGRPGKTIAASRRGEPIRRRDNCSRNNRRKRDGLEKPRLVFIDLFL
jgi:hypothetical protein